MIREVNIKVIPHKKQRYETVGDWQVFGQTLCIAVSDMMNWKMEMLVAIHELIEALLCEDRGITTKMVDDFDFKYEKERLRGKHKEADEPGDDDKYPCRKEHQIASIVERLLCEEFKLNWKKYDEVALRLSKQVKKGL